MELGLSTSVLGVRALPDRLKILAAHGVSWVEIHGYTPEDFDFGDWALVEATRQSIDRYGLRVWSCHSPAGDPHDLASSNPDVRTRSLAVMHDAMRAAAHLGARVFVCDAVGLRPERAQGRQARHARYAESLARLLDAAAGLGCRIAIENHTRDEALFVTPDDFLRLAAAPGLDTLGACWDTGHGWIEGQPPEAACRLGSRLVTLHIHDNDGRHDQHRLPWKGRIDWQPFIACLRRMRYRGPFMMELVPSAPTVDRIDRLVRDAVDVCSRLLRAGAATRSSMGVGSGARREPRRAYEVLRVRSMAW